MSAVLPPPWLIVFSGLPGTGKTTVAKALAVALGAVYLRIDTIEQAIRDAGVLAGDVGTSGYRVAHELATTQLLLGHRVIADGVNPVAESRQAWREVARHANARLLDIQVVCSDRAEHQRRVESRLTDIAGLTPPDWQAVLAHEYEPWAETPRCIDTALLSPPQAVAMIETWLEADWPGA